MKNKEKFFNLAIVGHVDHGKSTVIGRLLVETDTLPDGKLEQVKETCKRNSKPFEYAFLIDALKEEQAQGITIDSARVFFETDKRDYIIIDAPGHIDFLRNMVTGASRAEAALLVIDALDGVKDNSKRHGFLLSMLGVKQLVVLVNKMDLVSYDQGRFDEIVREYLEFLKKIQLAPMEIIPVSGFEGDNISDRGDSMPWYKGKTLLEAIDSFTEDDAPENRPLRMPVQGVYKFTAFGDQRRIVSGTLISGKVAVGDEISFYPSGKNGTVKSIEAFNREEQYSVGTGQAVGFTLTEQMFITRGEMAVGRVLPLPKVTTRLKVSLFWLGKRPMVSGRNYLFKLGTSKVSARLESIERVFDTSDLDSEKDFTRINTNSAATCVIKLNKAVAFDVIDDFQETSRFVIVDEYDISGGGIVKEALEDEKSWVRDKVLVRDYKWTKSAIPSLHRKDKFGQSPSVVFITGLEEAGKKPIAKALEKELFDEGRLVYFLGIGNVLYGIDADIKGLDDSREEHLRRLAEVIHIMLDAGMILIVTAIELNNEDVGLIKTAVDPDKIKVIWVGEDVSTDVEFDIKLKKNVDIGKNVEAIKRLLLDNGTIT